MSFPNKDTRRRCWDSRDRFWECLDKNQNDLSKCKEYQQLYEAECPAQWVKHFNRKREYLQFKDKMINESYEPIDDAAKS
ncbi:cytochrome c oxidase assembly factor 6 homolog isoform X2 [Centruroides sculpturatus]|uniref:cytochrome c oxidase assembly factor 6 homolog isoform X2 n=1 Tax=Centruroides sculpturatus TaxID=218467 RepID=UPI000C6D1AF4|nr:cytochrome c oxidase assembly factor 6 homolog isoform X2 [Centruroides sculpturatus]